MEIKKVAVIGAGTMGAGIAQICAQTGWETNLFDAYPEGLKKGMNSIDSFWNKGISLGKTTLEQKNKWASNLHPNMNLVDAVKDVDMVIEAVPEILEIKAVFLNIYNNIA